MAGAFVYLKGLVGIRSLSMWVEASTTDAATAFTFRVWP